MSGRTFHIAGCAIVVGWLCCAPGQGFAESLIDAIQLAYDTNPALRAQEAELRSVDEGYVQARAGFGPQVSINGQAAYQSARIQEPASIFSRATTTSFAASTGSADLSLVQPLYSGGAVTAQAGAAEANVLAGRETLRQAESQLILNVITAYIDVRRDRETLRILRDEISVLNVENDETAAKAKLGALSKTDAAQAEARLLATQAQLDQAQAQLNASTAEYLNVVGQNPGELTAEPVLPGEPLTADDAFNAADANNAQVRNAVEAEVAAREQVNEAKAAGGLSVSIRVDAEISPVEPYLPRQYDRSVGAALVFSKPLFTSGLNSSKIRQALEEDNRAILNVEATRRGVVQLVSENWARLATTRRSVALEERQIAAEEVAAKGYRLEERAGLRSTIDLLNSETELADSQISLAQSRHDEYLAGASLLSVMGLLEMRYLAPEAETYSPNASFDRVRSLYQAPWTPAIAALDGVGAPHTSERKMSPSGAGTERPTDLPASTRDQP